VTFVERKKFARIVDGKMWALLLGQMPEGISRADAGVDGHGECASAMRHRNFQ
jgi:hypothetical protein